MYRYRYQITVTRHRKRIVTSIQCRQHNVIGGKHGKYVRLNDLLQDIPQLGNVLNLTHTHTHTHLDNVKLIQTNIGN